jgi:uncharacterized protein (DUF1778 family)
MIEKKFGRPAVPDELRRDKTIPITVTQAEYDLIKQAATAAGVTASTFGRQAILSAAKRRVR